VSKKTGAAIFQKPVYHPIIYLPHQKTTKHDKLLLAFFGLALSFEQKVEPTIGKLIIGDKLSSSSVKLPLLIKAAGKLEKEIARMMETKTVPPLRLNDHCKKCEFHAGCLTVAKERDDLSLLKGLSGKEIDSLNKRGIFTVTQYSYTFRPRRAKKMMIRKTVKHHHSLNALAIRTQTVYVAGKLELPTAPTRVYLDVEGIPEMSFYYLIGLIIDDGKNVTAHSFWANDKSEEGLIWKSFLEIMEHITDYALFHYGSYETKFIKQMGSEYGGKQELINTIRSRCFNVLSAIYGCIYFPSYSNDLKSIASFLGFKWSEIDASGLQSIQWRAQWDETRSEVLKQKLTTYNREDCSALQTVLNACEKIGNDPLSTLTSCPTKLADETKADKPLGIFKRNNFVFPELDRINSCAYFDYQQSRVYIRTNSEIKKRLRKANRKTRLTYKANCIVDISAVLCCPCCGEKKPRKYGNYSKLVYDLKLFDGGIKRWIVQYDYKRYSCKACRKTFSPDTESVAPHKYGRSLVAWTVNQNIARLQPYRVIADELREIFGYHFRDTLPFLFKQQMARECNRAYADLMHNVCTGSYLHVDETDVNIMGLRGYVWVFANVESALYLFKPTREGAFLKELLGRFEGVLISDFYAAYDSLQCQQQKCLIHLIRDINECILKNPFDNELKDIGETFTRILVPIIESVDKYGLKRMHLHKYRHMVDRFLLMVDGGTYSSELAMNFQRRIMKYRDKLFTFMDYDGVPWNNNNAEHAIKQFVQLRRVIGGSSTEKGIREYLILLSICETLRLRNASFLRFLISGATAIDEFLKPAGKRAA
jgi:predicted RecB family nuclease